MFKNIGRKIKALAAIVFALDTGVAVFYGIKLMTKDDENLFFLGTILLVLGPLIAWVSSWLLYGYGEIIDKLCAIERNTRGETASSNAPYQSKEDRWNSLNRLRAEGLITEEEYWQRVQKMQ